MKSTSAKALPILIFLLMTLFAQAQTPAAPTVTGARFVCSGQATSLTASGASGATFAWYNAATGGTLLSSGATYTTPALTTATHFYVQQTVAGNTSARTDVHVLVSPIPSQSQPSGLQASPATICQGASSNLKATVDAAAGQYVFWYDAATGGNLLGSSASGANFSVSPSATKTYYAQSQIQQVTATYNFTGAVQTFTVPAGVTSLSIDALGAKGANGRFNYFQGGNGGRVQATMSVTPGDVLQLYVGRKGADPAGCSPCTIPAPWNGGGLAPNNVTYIGNGGDATDIRFGGTALSNRVLVAGGGGGAGAEGPSNSGGAGGGLTGANGASNAVGSYTAAQGGSQNAGGAGSSVNGTSAPSGSFGYGGNSADWGNSYGGPGGGGWYGGGGAVGGSGGAGGSSYTNPSYFQNVVHTQGFNNSEGQITITYNAGAACGVTNRVPVTVTVNTTPTVSAGADRITCAGTPVTLTATGANTYVWLPGNLTGSSITVSPASTTTYTVTGTLTAGGCSNTSTVTVSVSSVSATGTQTICSGNSANLSATGADTYTWQPGNISGQNITVNPTATTTYTVTGTNNSGCSTTATATVTVNPFPPVNAGADVTITQGSSVTLTASGATTYSWSPIPSTSASITFSPSVTTTYTVTGTNTVTGCQKSDQVVVTVIPATTVTGVTILCKGATTTLTAAGTAPFTWWSAATGGTLLFTGAVYTTPAITANTAYWVSGNGGARTKVNISVSDIINGATATPAIICPGGSSALSSASAGSTIDWYDAATGGNLLGSSASTASFTVSPAATKTYYAQTASVKQVTTTYNFTGAVQTFTVPAGVTSLSIDALGAKGANAGNPYFQGGNGGRVQATMNVTPGDVLQLYVGRKGAEPSGCSSCVLPWNGGGVGPNNSNSIGHGGDATDIRFGGTALTNRILVAGGGGGAGSQGPSSNSGGAGGGLTGVNGASNTVGSYTAAQGGSQNAGGAGSTLNGTNAPSGSFGYGGNSADWSNSYGGPAGGGWYGGGGAVGGSGGAGGSSYTSPAYFQNVVHTQGFNNSDGQITITYNAACTNTGRTPVTVTVSTPAAVASATTPVCAGTTINLTASGGANFSWTGPNGFTSNLQNPVRTGATAAMAGTYTVTVTNGNGCGASTASTVVAVTPTFGNPAVFGNGVWNVYAWNTGNSPASAGTWIDNYAGFYTATGLDFNTQSQWNANNSPSSAPGYQGCPVTNDVHSWSAKRQGFPCGNYRIDMPSHDDHAQLWINGTLVFEHTGCCDTHTNAWTGFLSSSSLVEFRATEGGGGSHGAITFTLLDVATAGSNSPRCTGNTLNLTATGGNSYSWTGPNGFTSNQQNPILTGATSTMTGTYTVTVTTANGCAITANTNVVVYPPVVASSNLPVCESGTINLTATSSGTSYSWTGPGGFTSNLQNPTRTGATPAMGGTYTVTVSNAACTSTASTTISVQPQPTGTMTAGGTVCLNAPSPLVTFTASGGSAPYTFTYTLNSGANQTIATAAGNATVTLPVPTTTAGTFEYKLVSVTNSQGCTWVNTANVVYAVYVLPVSVSAGSNVTICSGSSTTLTPSGGISYMWTSGAPVTIGTGAVLAAGMRRLNSSYNGPAIRLRRASDNAEMDFGFAGNDLDVDAITQFLNNAAGYCTTLYDQSGSGNHITQPVAAAQPAYSARALNMRPILHFTTTQYMLRNTNFPAPFTVVYGAMQSSATGRVLTAINNNWLLGWHGGQRQKAYFEGWVNNSTVPKDNNYYVYSATGNGSTSQLYENSNLIASNSAGLQGPNGLYLNGQAFNEMSDCDFTDVLVYNSVLSPAVRLAAENSIKDYYLVPGGNLTVSPTATTTYTLLGRNSNYCYSTSSVTVTVNPVPVADAGPSMAAICQGATTAALGGSFSGGATSAVWSDGGAGGTFANNGGTTPGTVTYTAGSTAPANVTLTLTTSGGSCGFLSSSKMLTVNPVAVVNLGPAIAGLCQGTATNALGGSFSGGATGAIWSDGGAGGTFTNNSGSTPGTATYTPGASPPATITLTLTSTGGSCGVATASRTLPVNLLPTATAGPAMTELCQKMTSPALGGTFGGGATGAIWTDGGAGGTFANNSGSTPSTATYTPSATASGTVQLTLTTSGGSCGSFVATKSLTVNPIPVVSAGSPVTMCGSNSTTLTATGADSYVWQPGNIAGSSITVTPAVTTTYTVTGTNASGCSSTISTTVVVNANPSAFIMTDGPTTFCAGGSVTLSAPTSDNNALQFNGSNYVEVTSAPTIPLGNSTYTIEAWVKPNSISGTNGIVGWGNYGAYGQANGFCFNGPMLLTNYWWGSDLTVSIPDVLDGYWHHVAVTFNGTTRSIYFDGILRGSDMPTGHNVPFASNLTIGKTWGSETFDGAIDEVRIWNNARAQTQIISGRGNSVPANSIRLAAYYKLDEGTGTITYDATGKGNNGTLVNSPVWMTPSNVPMNYSTNFTYSWSPGGATTSSITATTSGTYTVTITNASGCTNTASQTVTVSPPPAAPFSGLASAYCSSAADVLLTPTVAGGTFSGPGMSGSTFSPLTAGAGTHVISYTLASNGCTSVSTDTVTVIDNAQVQGAASPNPVNLFDNVTLQVVDPIPGALYGWELVGGSIPMLANGTVPTGIPGFPKAAAGTTVTAPAHLSGLVPYLLIRSYNTCLSFDTVYVQVNCLPALAGGTYTINNTSSTSGTNFRTLRDAAYRISNCGIAGPVDFQVSPGSGPYTERVELTQIPGATATNTVTFNGNGATLLYNNQLSYKQAAITLDGTDYVTIDNLHIAFAPTSVSGWGVHLLNAADHNVISNNTITLDNKSLDTRKWAGIVATAINNNLSFGGNNANDLRILHNTISGGVANIRLTGTVTDQLSGIVIEGNTLSGAFQQAISLSYINGPVVRGNVVSSRSSVTTSTGIWLVNSPAVFTISGNKVTSVGQYGIYLSSVNNTGAPERAMLSNNMVGGGFTNTTTASGILMNDADNVDVVFNSVNLTGNAPGAALDVNKPYATGLDIRNNSLAYSGTGGAYALRVVTAASAIQLNYNNYYSAGTAFAYYNSGVRASLTALRAVAFGPAGHDLNSRQGNPNYVSATDLHATGTQLANSGLNLASVNVDFDGEARATSGTSADIGADEFASPIRTAASAAQGSPAGFSAAAYPNPFTSRIAVSLSTQASGTVQLQLRDLTGRVILGRQVQVQEGASVLELTLESQLPEGVYLLQVQQGTEQEVIRLLKQ